MNITVVSYKGGVGKTTTAIHIAACLQQLAPTLLIDGDLNRSALAYARRGENSLPFMVVDENDAAGVIAQYGHLVIDTAARPSDAEIADLAEGSDLLIVPASPDALALDALLLTSAALDALKATYRVLLTMCPPRPARDREEAVALLVAEGIPHFDATIQRRAAFTKAALAGVLVGDVPGDPRAGAGWGEYQAVGAQAVAVASAGK